MTNRTLDELDSQDDPVIVAFEDETDDGPMPAAAVAVKMARLRTIAKEARTLWAEIGAADLQARKTFSRMVERTQWRRDAGLVELSDKELHAARAIAGRLAEVETAPGLSPYAATPIAAYNAIKRDTVGERRIKGQAMPPNSVSAVETAQSHRSEIARIVGRIAHDFRDPEVAEAIAIAVLAEVAERRRVELNMERVGDGPMFAPVGDKILRSKGREVNKTDRPSQASMVERERRNFERSKTLKER